MSIEIERYSDNLENEWDSFVFEKAKNATFLHSRKFYNHNPLNKEDDCSFIFKKNNKIVGLFPANIYEKEGEVIINSYLRATYGGLLYSDETGMVELLQIVDLIIDNAKKLNAKQIIIRPTFRIYANNLSDDLDYALWYKGFQTKSKETELAVNLKFPLKTNYTDTTIRNIKKAKKNQLSINEDGDLMSYWSILTDNLKEKHETKPVHSFEEISKLIELVGSDKVKLFTAELNGEVIAGILLFIANNLVSHAQYIASKSSFQEYRPLNLLIDYIIEWSKNNGFDYFNLGMANEPGGKELNEGLFRFKEGFGARGTLRETLFLKINQ